MTERELRDLSRRERQIMDVLLEAGEATARDVQRRLPDPPSYSAVRAMLAKLEAKGVVRHHKDGRNYVWTPGISREAARSKAVDRLVRVFYHGSVEAAVTGLLGGARKRLSTDELDRIEDLVRQAREETSDD